MECDNDRNFSKFINFIALLTTGIVEMHLQYFEFGMTDPKSKWNNVVKVLVLFEELQTTKKDASTCRSWAEKWLDTTGQCIPLLSVFRLLACSGVKKLSNCMRNWNELCTVMKSGKLNFSLNARQSFPDD